jgi:lantibiotic modifying enzyme
MGHPDTRLEAVNFVNRAKEAAVKNPPRPADTLCCGNFGNVDFLLEIANGDKDLQSLARSRAVWLIDHGHRDGSYIFDGADGEANLGLFPGISGIGYVILRTLAPRNLPSLLTFGTRVK